jgi:hypothetical protein
MTSSLRKWCDENRIGANGVWSEQEGGGERRNWETKVSLGFIENYLRSRAMWAVFILQDLTGIKEHLIRQLPEAERIGDQADGKWKWNYRLPYSLEEISEDLGFISVVKGLVAANHRT